MPAADSKDLRERAIAHMKEGVRGIEIAKFLKISMRSVYRWWAGQSH
jgi:transposase